MLPNHRAARALLRRSIEAGADDPIRASVDAVYLAAMSLGINQVHREPVSPRGFTINQSRKVWDRDGWECVSCRTHVDLTVDHIIPVSRGGSDELDNLQTMCRPCNSRKGAR
jgi:hypothetical protein